jgi:hypothetical protein
LDNNLTVEATGIDHRVAENSPARQAGDRDDDYVWHASYALTDLFADEYWPGDLIIGARRFDNSVGQVSELYVSREFIHGAWIITPGANYIARSGRPNRFGFTLDTRYYVSPYVNLFATYNSKDFYKSIANDFLAPATSLGALAQCSDCEEGSASVGLDYNVLREHGGVYLQVFDVGDLNAPMGGLYINF